MRRTAGLTILETVIAAFIFIVTLVGLMSVWATHSRAIGKARSILIANELSESVMEKCLAARYERVDEFNGETEVVDIQFVIKDVPITNQFTSIVTVTDASPTIKTVVVRVEWQDTTGDRFIELHSQLHSSA